MRETILQRAKETAVRAVKEAGEIHRSLFGRAIGVEEKGQHGDLVTEADHRAEAAILRILAAEFPDHQIRSEETGWAGVESEWLWLVDPLDGTNNFAIGLPVYGVSVTLIHRQEPLLGVIYEPVTDTLYVAERGKGAQCNGLPLRLADRIRHTTGKPTVGWIQGHQVQMEERPMRLKHHLDTRSKRVLRLWAPTLLWCALARGDIDGIVLYNSEGDDLYSGILIAQEAGAAVVDFEGNLFAGMNNEPYIIACRPDQTAAFLELVRQGLEGNA
ncbi:inositol monophosphatase family protein [Paenibacillus thermotolerans]|uniref:inositol monophosphatase family protein n=1 Tax=Paenibacillus thermotolerans TaxID=3027807 RepID=UPI002368C74D|nr:MULTISPECIES: inositol monophosphatase family protein [unclassified Paenibacillus]